MFRLRPLDPLAAFVLLGGLLAALHAWTRPPEPVDSDRRIVVTDADLSIIADGFRQRRLRPPTREELTALVDAHVRDEMLYREAVELGFDRDDPALRRRIATKLEFLAREAGAAAEPSEGELRAFFAAHAASYAAPPRRAFEHVYFSEQARGGRAEDDARAALDAIAGQPEGVPAEPGDPILLERVQPPSTRDEIAGRFGGAFADGVFALEPGTWGGPVRSGFGVHLVRVREEVDGGSRAFEEVRERVRTDLLQQRRDDALDVYVAALRSKYAVDMRATALAGEPEAR